MKKEILYKRIALFEKENNYFRNEIKNQQLMIKILTPYKNVNWVLLVKYHARGLNGVMVHCLVQKSSFYIYLKALNNR